MTVTVRLTAEEEARLEALSRRTGRTKSFYVREAIRAHLEDLEDTYAADEAVRAYEDSGRKSRPLGEFMAELGITDGDLDEGRAANAAGGR